MLRALDVCWNDCDTTPMQISKGSWVLLRRVRCLVIGWDGRIKRLRLYIPPWHLVFLRQLRRSLVCKESTGQLDWFLAVSGAFEVFIDFCVFRVEFTFFIDVLPREWWGKTLGGLLKSMICWPLAHLFAMHGSSSRIARQYILERLADKQKREYSTSPMDLVEERG